jgi:hypothetical protein
MKRSLFRNAFVLLLVASLILCLLALVGCGGDDGETTTDGDTTTTTSEPEGDGGGEGLVTPTGEQLPALTHPEGEKLSAAPSEEALKVPIYPGAEVDKEWIFASWEKIYNDQKTFEVSAKFTTDDSFADVSSFYKEELGEPESFSDHPEGSETAWWVTGTEGDDWTEVSMWYDVDPIM